MIKITEKAKKRILDLRQSAKEESDKSIPNLRVAVIVGGCSGLSYKLEFEKNPPGKDDKVFELDGVTVVIDSKSHLYLAGTEIDFSDGLNGTGFVFNNPNSKRDCGCGFSFNV